MINYKPKGNAYLLPTVLGAALLLSGCWGKTLDFRNAEIVHGKIYTSGANSPFSGRVTNIDLFKIPNLNNGASPIVNTLNPLIGASPYASDKDVSLGDLCDVSVKDGVLQGKGLCKTGDNVMSEFSFENGVLQNHLKMSNKTSEYVIAEADFDNGLLDGKMALSNPDNGKLIYRTKWKEGKQDGDVIRYTLDGKYPLYKGSLVGGKRDGVEEIYHATTHKLINELHWDNGIRSGSEKRWSDDGSVLLADLNWLFDSKESGFEKEMDATGAKLLVDLTWQSGKATGFKTVVHADSGIVSYYDEYHIKDDLFDGAHKRYERGYLDDKNIIFLSEVSNFKKGKLDGHYQKLLSNGTAWNEGNYKDDLKDGLYQWFDSNGKIQDERTYKDGVEIMVPIPAGPDVNYEKCIKNWVVARRIESGRDMSLASISESEFIEFKTLCEQGKTPTSH